ncbi:MAG: class I SAM-dependent methyltransferase [Elusimicrobiales bacterium]
MSRWRSQENIPRALRKIADWRGKNIAELGAGTGRLTLILATESKSITAFDNSTQMLAVARKKLEKADIRNWRLKPADNRKIPLPNNCADITISAWSISYLAQGAMADWQPHVDAALDEMRRLLIAGGTAVIIESLGTGSRKPAPPNRRLAVYYNYLERQGFARSSIRTDYKFKTKAEAAELAEFFFGEEMGEKIKKSGSRILPECTGIWHWRKTGLSRAPSR